MTADEAIAIVNSRAAGRTRWLGSPPYVDEVLVQEIARLRAALCAAGLDDIAAGSPAPDGLSDRGA
jgi:hypothetical protein